MFNVGRVLCPRGLKQSPCLSVYRPAMVPYVYMIERVWWSHIHDLPWSLSLNSNCMFSSLLTRGRRRVRLVGFRLTVSCGAKDPSTPGGEMCGYEIYEMLILHRLFEHDASRYVSYCRHMSDIWQCILCYFCSAMMFSHMLHTLLLYRMILVLCCTTCFRLFVPWCCILFFCQG
jgi:hypothetical protein